jgi:hypothetical protein
VTTETRRDDARGRDQQRSGAQADGRDETRDERADRNLQELLTELRVALPGVQILFGFLLVVPFSQRFGQVSDFEEAVYLAVLLLTTLATALLIAPTAIHRVLFGMHMKETVVADSNRLTIAGLVALALAMTGAVLLITHFLFGSAAAVVTSVAAGAAFLLLWAALPASRRADSPRSTSSVQD